MKDSIATAEPRLTPRQRRAARYLALGLSQRVTATRMCMNDRTLRRWITDVPGFAALVDELRATGAEEDAADVLRDLLYSADERVRLAAAQGLLKLAPKARADEDEDADLLEGWK